MTPSEPAGAGRVLISGAFDDAAYRFGFFERIAEALEARGWAMHRFNALGFSRRVGSLEKVIERLFTLPGRWLGILKERVRAALPWAADGQRERALIAKVRSFRPDTLIVMSSFRFQPETLSRCRAFGVSILVGWYIEGPIESGVPEVQAPLYDCYHCIHRELTPAWRGRIGWLPSYALDRAGFHPLHTPRVPQPRIVFVSSPNKRRLRYLAALRGLPLDLWEPGWQRHAQFAALYRGDFIWGTPLNALYNDSAIVLNVASWEPGLSGMTQRVVEVPASGAFLLTDDAAELRRLYVTGEEVAVFDGPDDLRAKCAHYLAHADEREAIAARGHRRALAFDDYAATAAVLIGGAPPTSA